MRIYTLVTSIGILSFASAHAQETPRNKPGFDVGADVAPGGVAHCKFFVEAKWGHALMTNSHVDYVPVSSGFRW